MSMVDWRKGECHINALLGDFLKERQYTDVTFHLRDGSSLEAHKLILSVSNPVFEAMFFGSLADRNIHDFDITVEPVAFRRLLDYIYNSGPIDWSMNDPDDYWNLLEAADMYMNTRLVDYCMDRLKRSVCAIGQEGSVLRHLVIAKKYTFAEELQSSIMTSIIENTWRYTATEEWNNLEEDILLGIYEEEALNVTEGELYLAAERWCRAKTGNEEEAQAKFLDKFVPRIQADYISQKDFTNLVAKEDSILCDPNTLKNWSVRIMSKNVAEASTRGSHHPLQVLEFNFCNNEDYLMPLEEETPRMMTNYNFKMSKSLNYKGKLINVRVVLYEASQGSQFGPHGLTNRLEVKYEIDAPDMLIDSTEVHRFLRRDFSMVVKLKNGSFESYHETRFPLNEQGHIISNIKVKLEEILFVKVFITFDARNSILIKAATRKQLVEHFALGRNHTQLTKETKDFTFKFTRIGVWAPSYVASQHELAYHGDVENGAEEEIVRVLDLPLLSQPWLIEHTTQHPTNLRDFKITSGRFFKARTNIIGKQEILTTDTHLRILEKFHQSPEFKKSSAGKDYIAHKVKQVSMKYWIMHEVEYSAMYNRFTFEISNSNVMLPSVCSYNPDTQEMVYCGIEPIKLEPNGQCYATEEFFNAVTAKAKADVRAEVFINRHFSSIWQSITSDYLGQEYEGKVEKIMRNAQIDLKELDIIVVMTKSISDEDGVCVCYDSFVEAKRNEIEVSFLLKSNPEVCFNLTLGSTSRIGQARAKLSQVVGLSVSAIYECYTTMGKKGSTGSMLASRRSSEYPISEMDDRKIIEMFGHCKDGSKIIFYSTS